MRSPRDDFIPVRMISSRDDSDQFSQLSKQIIPHQTTNLCIMWLVLSPFDRVTIKRVLIISYYFSDDSVIPSFFRTARILSNQYINTELIY